MIGDDAGKKSEFHYVECLKIVVRDSVSGEDMWKRTLLGQVKRKESFCAACKKLALSENKNGSNQFEEGKKEFCQAVLALEKDLQDCSGELSERLLKDIYNAIGKSLAEAKYYDLHVLLMELQNATKVQKNGKLPPFSVHEVDHMLNLVTRALKHFDKVKNRFIAVREFYESALKICKLCDDTDLQLRILWNLGQIEAPFGHALSSSKYYEKYCTISKYSHNKGPMLFFAIRQLVMQLISAKRYDKALQKINFLRNNVTDGGDILNYEKWKSLIENKMKQQK